MTRIRRAMLSPMLACVMTGIGMVLGIWVGPARGQTSVYADCPSEIEAGLLSENVSQAQCRLDPDNGVVVDVDEHDVANGADFSIVITNKSLTDTLMLPALRMIGIPLGDDPSVVQYLHQVTDTYFDNFGSDYTSDIRRYPENLYSPVMIARSPDLYIGVSILYFDLDNPSYQHSVLTKLKHIPSLGWQCSFLLDDVIRPQEVRQYTVCFRSQPSSIGDGWPSVIEPYRTYFQNKYRQKDGSIARYERSMEPVIGFKTSDSNLLTGLNPRGFSDYRPDLDGFERMIGHFIEKTQQLHYQIAIVWTPGGQYLNNQWCNLPPQITTGWTTPMNQSAYQWLKFSDPNGDGDFNDALQLLFWWGRAAACPQVSSPDDWDVPCISFDPTDPNQADIMTREWSNSLMLGATGVVMDAFPTGAGGVFTSIPSRPAIDWLAHLRDVAQSMGVNDPVLVTEQECSDVVNVFAPTLMPSAINGRTVTTPQYLADYLIPDHETWSLYSEDGNVQERARRGRELISMGYRPLFTFCDDCPDRNQIVSLTVTVPGN